MTRLNLISFLSLFYFVDSIYQVLFIKENILFWNSKFPQPDNDLFVKPNGLYSTMENFNALGKKRSIPQLWL